MARKERRKGDIEDGKDEGKEAMKGRTNKNKRKVLEEESERDVLSVD
jgi:hypothetical protein